MDFDQMVEQYHQVMAEFTKANPVPVTTLFSQRDDVTLAGGMGGITRGSKQVTKNIEVAASQFHEGRISFQTLSKYVTDDFAYLVEVERYEAELFGSEEMGVSVIRCTTIFRREEGSGRSAIDTVIPYQLSGQSLMRFHTRLFQFKKRFERRWTAGG